MRLCCLRSSSLTYTLSHGAFAFLSRRVCFVFCLFFSLPSPIQRLHFPLARISIFLFPSFTVVSSHDKLFPLVLMFLYAAIRPWQVFSFNKCFSLVLMFLCKTTHRIQLFRCIRLFVLGYLVA